MQKLKYMGYIIFILVIIFLIFIVYNNVQGKENEETQIQDKLETEIRYLESNIVSMLNSMRGLEYKKYEVVKKEESKEDKQNIENTQNKQNEEDENKEGKQNEEKEKTYTFSLAKQKIDIEEQPNFENIEKVIAEINVSTPIITLDLYKLGVSSENVLAFTKNLDELSININQKNQMEGIKKLVNMYTLINNYAQKAKMNIEYVKALQTKQKIFEAYMLLDYNKWEDISNKTKEATNIFGELFNEKNIEPGKQDKINTVYVMLNELNASVNLKNKKLFLEKYLKVLDEMQVL